MILIQLIFLLVFLPLSGTDAASVPERGRLFRENKLLKAEHDLAIDQQIYLVFKPTEKKIHIKASGVILKELLVENCKVWGPLIPLKPLKLVKKSALSKPKRTIIRPKENDGVDPLEFKVLEIDEMPARYCLHFDEGVWVYIRSTPDGVISHFLNISSSLKSYIITKPLVTIWNALHRKTFTEMDIYLSQKDAKSLYWVLTEGSLCIIYHG